jgi:hypothetical protein
MGFRMYVRGPMLFVALLSCDRPARVSLQVSRSASVQLEGLGKGSPPEAYPLL